MITQNTSKEPTTAQGTATRDAYQAKVQAELTKMNARIDEYRAKAEQAKADVEANYYSQIEELLSKRDAAQSKLEELQQSSEAAWQDLQKGFESAWNEFSHAMERASQRFES